FQKGDVAPKAYLLPVAALAIYALAISIVYTYWKNSPAVTVDNHTITIGNQTFYFKDIKHMALTGKMPFRFIVNYPMEAIAIVFNDGTEKILFDDMYANSAEIKLFLDHVFLKKQKFDPTLTAEIDRDELLFEYEDTFKGNQFTSMRGITLWGFIGFIAFMTTKVKTPQTGAFIAFGFFATFWFVLHAWLMHYFGLTKDYLIVRNHNFIWKEKIYRLSNIKEVVFETQGKQPNSMRIITNDFRNKLYPAGTLRDEMWLDMKRALESRGVKVRNECIFEDN
ncbi:MAG: hypothetical protein ABUL44_00285, partial [Flavobacterium sp.]